MPVQRFSTNLGISLIPEIDQYKYKSIFIDSSRVRQALQVLQTGIDRYTGAVGPESSSWANIDPTSYLMTGNTARFYALASEAISAGAMVNLYNNAGTINARNANATAAGKPARAFAQAAVNSGSVGEFFLLGLNSSLSGLTPGSLYYLSNTNGVISTTAGTVSQKVGFALSATKLFFNPELIA